MGSVKHATSFLHQIVTNNIPIENLHLDLNEKDNNLDSFIEIICRLSTLKSLGIYFERSVWNSTYLTSIGKHLPELTHLVNIPKELLHKYKDIPIGHL